MFPLYHSNYLYFSYFLYKLYARNYNLRFSFHKCLIVKDLLLTRNGHSGGINHEGNEHFLYKLEKMSEYSVHLKSPPYKESCTLPDRSYGLGYQENRRDNLFAPFVNSDKLSKNEKN